MKELTRVQHELARNALRLWIGDKSSTDLQLNIYLSTVYPKEVADLVEMGLLKAVVDARFTPPATHYYATEAAKALFDGN